MNINAIQVSNLIRIIHLTRLSLIITSLLLKVDFTRGHDSRCNLETIPFFLIGKSNDVKGLKSHLQLFIIINWSNRDLTLRDISIVIDVIPQTASGLHFRNCWLQQLIENMIRALHKLLLSNTRLFQKVRLNVTSTKFSRGGEMNPDKFTKTWGIVIPGCLGISVWFQNGVGCHNLVLKSHFLGRLFSTWGNSS